MTTSPISPELEIHNRLTMAVWQLTAKEFGADRANPVIAGKIVDAVRALLPTPAKGDPWTSVKDRLPTHIYSVLGVVVDGPMVIEGDPDDRMRDVVSYNPEDCHWYQYVGGDSLSARVTVTHWQDLPDMPCAAPAPAEQSDPLSTFDDYAAATRWPPTPSQQPASELMSPEPSYVPVYSVTLKSRAAMRRDIPEDRRGWYVDVAGGQTLTLRDATPQDLARCSLGDGHSKDPADWLCEVFDHGALVDRAAVSEMHPLPNLRATLAQAQR